VHRAKEKQHPRVALPSPNQDSVALATGVFFIEGSGVKVYIHVAQYIFPDIPYIPTSSHY